MPIIATGMRFNSAYSLWLTSPQSHLLLMSQGDVPAFSWLLLSRLATFYLVPHPGQFAQNHVHNLAGLPLPHQFRIRRLCVLLLDQSLVAHIDDATAGTDRNAPNKHDLGVTSVPD
jgi:hypothetical protein